MRKFLVSILIIVTLVAIISGCSKKENIQFNNFYGDTEKWLVIRTNDNVFKFIYKGNAEDLKKNNNTGKISFHYGTSLGTIGATQLLNNTNYYQVEFKDDLITELPSNSTFNGNKFINVQIGYADTTDSIDLAAYMEYKVK
ncbi:MAG TPA: hypothetical protein VIO64_03850 [Pseudobacteroides sp.]|uniref:hypothetical protein n=1 Tax=Pseudobacteroides sp. TaxID=1968840 RepID=UPI002F95AD6E